MKHFPYCLVATVAFVSSIRLSEIIWQRICIVPKYWTLTFVARICSWDVSKSSAHSGNVQSSPFLSALLMYDITNLSLFFSFYYTKIPFCLISFNPERNDVFSLYYFTFFLAYSSHIATIHFIDVCKYSFWSPHYTVHYITQITDGDLFAAPCTA